MLYVMTCTNSGYETTVLAVLEGPEGFPINETYRTLYDPNAIDSQMEKDHKEYIVRLVEQYGFTRRSHTEF